MSDFILMNQNMVKGQIIPENVVNPRLIEAFLHVPREKFVPRQLARIAYMDAAFPLTQGRCLLRPATLARLLQALDPQPLDNILYIGGGTGYGPALLSHMSAHVIALDCEEAFTQQAEKLVSDLNLPSIEIILGPLKEGWDVKAPYDKIFIEGGVEYIPQRLLSQLKEGGKLITIKHQKAQESRAVQFDNIQGTVTEIPLFDAFAPRLKAFQKQKSFIF